MRPGTSRAKRSRLSDQRSSASTAPGSTAGSGSILPPGKVRTAPPRLQVPGRGPHDPESSRGGLGDRRSGTARCSGARRATACSAATTRRSSRGDRGEEGDGVGEPRVVRDEQQRGRAPARSPRPSTSAPRAIRSSAQAPPAASPDSPTILVVGRDLARQTPGRKPGEQLQGTPPRPASPRPKAASRSSAQTRVSASRRPAPDAAGPGLGRPLKVGSGETLSNAVRPILALRVPYHYRAAANPFIIQMRPFILFAGWPSPASSIS